MTVSNRSPCWCMTDSRRSQRASGPVKRGGGGVLEEAGGRPGLDARVGPGDAEEVPGAVLAADEGVVVEVPALGGVALVVAGPGAIDLAEFPDAERRVGRVGQGVAGQGQPAGGREPGAAGQSDVPRHREGSRSRAAAGLAGRGDVRFTGCGPPVTRGGPGGAAPASGPQPRCDPGEGGSGVARPITPEEAIDGPRLARGQPEDADERQGRLVEVAAMGPLLIQDRPSESTKKFSGTDAGTSASCSGVGSSTSQRSASRTGFNSRRPRYGTAKRPHRRPRTSTSTSSIIGGCSSVEGPRRLEGPTGRVAVRLRRPPVRD